MIITNIDTLPANGTLYFSATWCQPCKQMKPLVESSEKEILYIDIEENEDLVQEYNIRSVPTFIKLSDGIEQNRVIGPMSKTQFDSFVN